MLLVAEETTDSDIYNNPCMYFLILDFLCK